MNYMGGKHRQGTVIARYIKQVLEPGQLYVEPFCGALGVASRVAPHVPMILADISLPLINMWRAFQDPALVLPDEVSEEEYLRVKAVKDPEDWRTAYYGFGMSFGSKYWGGYARNAKGTNYATNLKRSTNLKRQAVGDADFVHADYTHFSHLKGAVVYCDPPYAGRTKAHNCPEFDHRKFWGWCRRMVSQDNIVMVTEFVTPPDFEIIHDFGDTVVRHHSALPSDGTREVLVCHRSQHSMFWGGDHG